MFCRGDVAPQEKERGEEFPGTENRIVRGMKRSSTTFWTAEAFTLPKVMLPENPSAVVSVL